MTKFNDEAATAWSDALSAPTSAEQGVEAMSPEGIADAQRRLSNLVGPLREVTNRLLAIAADHARLKAENAALRASVAKMSEALDFIDRAYIPDTPRGYGGDELMWVQKWVMTLRNIARKALQPAQAGADDGGKS